MPCNGNCLGLRVAPIEPIEDITTKQLYNTETRVAHDVYTPLTTSHFTRVLALHRRPSLLEVITETNSLTLRADLLTVEVHPQRGVYAAGIGKTINYTALSYTWGDRNDCSRSIVCNGTILHISQNLALALESLPHDIKYLWVDALCINQHDDREKSQQVSRMLSIFQEAESVTAWLGPSNEASHLAFACFSRSVETQHQLGIMAMDEHVPSCNDELRRLSNSLLSVYASDWLSRTWVRQEIYGARKLIVQCGSQRVSWQDFERGATWVKQIGKLLKDTDHKGLTGVLKSRLSDAQRNVYCASILRRPRDLASVLLESGNFNLTNRKDLFYAVLGMCDVPIHHGAPESVPADAIVVDYGKTLTEIYADAARYIVSRGAVSGNLKLLWLFYKRGPLHAKSLPISDRLPTWAVDWQTGIQNHQEHRSLLAVYTRHLYPSRHSINHLEMGSASLRTWYVPQPLPDNKRVLGLQARAASRVVYVSGSSCALAFYLVLATSIKPHFALDSNGFVIYMSPAALTLIKSDSANEDPVHAYEATKDFGRLGLLDAGVYKQICLLPAESKVGDMVLAVTLDMLPILVRPLRGGANDVEGLARSEHELWNDAGVEAPRTVFQEVGRPVAARWRVCFGATTLVLLLQLLTTPREADLRVALQGAMAAVNFYALLVQLLDSCALDNLRAEQINMARTTAELWTPFATSTLIDIYVLLAIGAGVRWTRSQSSTSSAFLVANSISMIIVVSMLVIALSVRTFLLTRALWRLRAQSKRQSAVYAHLDQATRIYGEDIELIGPVMATPLRSLEEKEHLASRPIQSFRMH